MSAEKEHGKQVNLREAREYTDTSTQEGKLAQKVVISFVAVEECESRRERQESE